MRCSLLHREPESPPITASAPARTGLSCPAPGEPIGMRRGMLRDFFENLLDAGLGPPASEGARLACVQNQPGNVVGTLRALGLRPVRAETPIAPGRQLRQRHGVLVSPRDI